MPFLAIAQTSPVQTAKVEQQIAELAALKASRTPTQKKIDSVLLDTRTMWLGKPITKSVPALQTGIWPDAQGMIEVDLFGQITNLLIMQLQGLGVEIENAHPEYGTLRARIPMQGLESIASLPSVGHIRQADRAFTNEGSVTSEGDVAHKADVARSLYGLSGAGIKVGVMSDGNDFMSTSQASGDLPPTIDVVAGHSGREGTAMMEIVHDLAPGAHLAFATAYASPADFAANIIALANAGCEVICDDITYLAEPAFQDGPISQAIDQVGNQGVMFFTSAGNENRLSAGNSGVWEGDWNYSGTTDALGQIHQFPGGLLENFVTSNGTYMSLQWTDPLGGSGNDYDLYLVDSSGTIIAKSDNTQDGNDDPIELTATGQSGLRMVVRKAPAAAARFIRVNAFRAKLAVGTNGETYGHHGANFAFDVAAVDAKHRTTPFTAANNVEQFSSDGPRRMFFKPNGVAYTPGNFSSTGGISRAKPDITAADGVVTSVSGFSPFYGTSAAAPHAAAIAALLLEHKGNHTFASLRNLFGATSLDIMAPGEDVDSGVGLIMAEPAMTKQVGDSYTTFSVLDTSIAKGATTTATIRLNLPAPPSGLKFLLSSDDAAKVSVPAFVKIPAGSKQKTFVVTGVSATTGTDIHAALDHGGPSKTISMIVTAKSGAAKISSLTLDPTQLQGGTSSTGTVTLTKVTNQTFTVNLTSSNPAAVVPATVDVPAGSSSATFTVTTKAVAALTTATITAKKTNGGSATADLKILTPKLTSLTFNPTHVTGGTSSIGTVTISSPAPFGGLTVTLTSANPGRVGVPATVKIPFGLTSKTFTATTTAGAKATVKVTASATGSGSTFKSLVVNP